MKTTIFLFPVLSLTLACGGDTADDGGNEEEVITTVTLTFTPDGGGAEAIAVFDDPDGDGGDPPTVDPVSLAPGNFTLAITFENGLEEPPEDITAEVADEGDEHQVFLLGTAVDGPASNSPGAPLTHSYNDVDINGNPIGLTNDITAAAGSGALRVILRHLPPISGAAVKSADLAEQVSAGGITSIAGDSDVQIDFDVSVQ